MDVMSPSRPFRSSWFTTSASNGSPAYALVADSASQSLKRISPR